MHNERLEFPCRHMIPQNCLATAARAEGLKAQVTKVWTTYWILLKGLLHPRLSLSANIQRKQLHYASLALDIICDALLIRAQPNLTGHLHKTPRSER